MIKWSRFIVYAFFIVEKVTTTTSTTTTTTTTAAPTTTTSLALTTASTESHVIHVDYIIKVIHDQNYSDAAVQCQQSHGSLWSFDLSDMEATNVSQMLINKGLEETWTNYELVVSNWIMQTGKYISISQLKTILIMCFDMSFNYLQNFYRIW